MSNWDEKRKEKEFRELQKQLAAIEEKLVELAEGESTGYGSVGSAIERIMRQVDIARINCNTMARLGIASGSLQVSG
jgi:hypothetical protein